MNHHQESNGKWLGGQCPYVNCQIITFITIIRECSDRPSYLLVLTASSWPHYLSTVDFTKTQIYSFILKTYLFFDFTSPDLSLTYVWLHSLFQATKTTTGFTFLPLSVWEYEGSPLPCKGNTWQGVMSVATQRGSEPRVGPAGLAQSPHAPFTVPVMVSSSLNPSVSFLIRTVSQRDDNGIQ